MIRLLLINGPNLNLLGVREPGIYGRVTLDSAVAAAQKRARALQAELEAFQANGEGALVDAIQGAVHRFDGLILNPGAYTHTSVAVRDAIQGVALPCVEVHLSNLYARETFRQHSVTAPACVGLISGFGVRGYELAVEALVAYLAQRKETSAS